MSEQTGDEKDEGSSGRITKKLIDISKASEEHAAEKDDDSEE